MFKTCYFYRNTFILYNPIDYKNVNLLRKFITIQGKVLPKRLTKTHSKEHRLIVKSIKKYRVLGMLPFVNKE